MFCNNCGRELEENAVFCTNCGLRVEKTETAPTVQPAETAEQPIYEQAAPAVNYALPSEKEKKYLGKGAFAFCLVVIGLLAVSTGIFAGLYFSVI